jgi:hypothetical protein
MPLDVPPPRTSRFGSPPSPEGRSARNSLPVLVEVLGRADIARRRPLARRATALVFAPDRGSQVRIRLAAGGSRIRNLGPPATASPVHLGARDATHAASAKPGMASVASQARPSDFRLPGRPSHGLGSRPSKTRRFNSKAAPPPTVKLVWASFAAQADKEGWRAGRFLAAFAEHEIAERSRRRLERHLGEARLPPGKTLFASSTLIKKIDQPVEAGDAVGKSLTYDFFDLVVPELQRRGRYKLDYDIGPRRRTSQNHRVWHARVMPERGNMGSPRLIPARGASSGSAAFRRRRAGPKTVRRRNRSPSWASAMTYRPRFLPELWLCRAARTRRGGPGPGRRIFAPTGHLCSARRHVRRTGYPRPLLRRSRDSSSHGVALRRRT